MQRVDKAIDKGLAGAPHKSSVGVRRSVDEARKRRRFRRALFGGQYEDLQRRECLRIANAMVLQMSLRKELRGRSDAWRHWYDAVIRELRAASRHNLKMMEEMCREE